MCRVAWCFVLLAACGGAAVPSTRNVPRTGADEQSTGDEPELAVGAPDRSTTPAPTSRSSAVAPPPIVLPAGRTDGPLAEVPELADAAYARLLAAPVSLDVPSRDTAAGIQELVRRIHAASVIAGEVCAACAPHAEDPSTAVRVALTLEGDAFDLVASRTASATLALDPAAPRASAQLRRCGEDFVRSCGGRGSL